MRWVALTSIGAAVLAAMAAPVLAQAPDLDRLVGQLSASDAVARLAASEELVQSPGITLPQIEESLLRDELSLEQRYRLLVAARKRFDMGPRPALGVSFDQTQREVRIERVYPQFPSFRLLRVGDRIDAVDGRKVGGLIDVRAVILSHEPGDALEATVFRDGASQVITVPLGRFADLERAGAPDEQSLDQAWELRSHAYAGLQTGKPAVIDCGIAQDAWGVPDQAPPDPRTRTRVRPRSTNTDPAPTVVVAGGESRGATDDDPFFIAGQLAGRVRVVGGNANDFARQMERQAAQQDYQLAKLARQQAMAQLRENEARIADARTPETVRTQLTQESASLRQQITILDVQIGALEARLR